MSTRPLSPRSVSRVRSNRCTLLFPSSMSSAAFEQHPNDALMTINENRNAAGSVGTGSHGHDTSDTSSTSSSSSSSGSESGTFEQYAGTGPGAIAGSPSAAASASGHHHRHSMDQSVDSSTLEQVNNNAAFGMQQQQLPPHERPLMNGCEDKWSWNKRDRSKEVWLSGANNRKVHFHPNWSKGTAGIRGTRVLNNGRYYWEISVSQRVFGTSMMFGIGTKKARLHVNMFTNLLGEDRNGWGLSHKGLLWHGGIARNYTKRFKENQATKVGILFDGIAGTLTYYKDDVCLGVAFRGLNEIREPLYPIVCSTAAKTEMILTETRRDFVNLQDRCRAVIIKHINTQEKLDRLALPYCIKNYLAEAVTDSATTTQMRPLDLHMTEHYLL
ncbi:SPRY domain-containing SOCS box protein 3-like [Anopheles albimanus]|uniref:SPRY domain-containing SOCS box protein 3-like n=1 Tax=Anopheles albimanus TaxID=7167 RepID=UPI00163EFA49|nr:SPRY domain-containing SOCS box protein 3-like [Anopheles albimanus]